MESEIAIANIAKEITMLLVDKNIINYPEYNPHNPTTDKVKVICDTYSQIHDTVRTKMAGK